MKLSDDTVEILKNFATINSGIVIKPGNKLHTLSANKSVLAEAEVAEEFDRKFGIGDLRKLLAITSMSTKKGDEPEVVFEDKFLGVKTKDNNGLVKIRYTQPDFIKSAPDGMPNPPFEEVFDITPEILQWINNAALILKAPNIVMKSDSPDEDIIFLAMDVDGDMPDEANVSLGIKSKHAFKAIIRIDNMQLIPGGYKCSVSSTNVVKLQHKDRKLTYWIGMDQKKSTFTK